MENRKRNDNTRCDKSKNDKAKQIITAPLLPLNLTYVSGGMTSGVCVKCKAIFLTLMRRYFKNIGE